MQVTLERAASLAPLAEPVRWSNSIAVAQWRRSAAEVAAARLRLLELGLSDREITRRRRAEASDPALATRLRLAVTMVIAAGRLTAGDLQRVQPPLAEGELRAIADAVGDALARVRAVAARAGAPPIDLDVGEY